MPLSTYRGRYVLMMAAFHYNNKELEMALPGETGHVGSSCKDCGIELKAQVLSSNAGYYIGTACNCGPYSRESGYYKTHKEAKAVLFLEHECGCKPVAARITYK